MADICFDRSDRTALAIAAAARHHFADGGRFDWITDRRAGAVRFHVINIRRPDARFHQNLFQHILLRIAARDRHSRGSTILIDGRRADDCINLVALGDGRPQGFQQDRACPFTAYIAICSRVEGSALAVARQHRRLAKADREFGSEHHLHTAGNRQRTLAGAKALTRNVNRCERRGARRVDRETRPAQVIDVRQAVSGDAGGRAAVGIKVNIGSVRGIHLHITVVVRRDADKHPATSARQLTGRQTGVFAGFPEQFQQKTMLWINAGRLTWRHTEELRIKPFDALQKGSPTRVQSTGFSRIRIEELPEVRTAGRNLRDSVETLREQFPERVRPAGPAGITATDSNDRDPLVTRMGHRMVGAGVVRLGRL